MEPGPRRKPRYRVYWETDLPSVLADRVTYRGADYAISDISIPDAPELCAAVCLEDNERGLRNE